MNYKKYARVLDGAFEKKDEKDFNIFFNNYIKLLKKNKHINLLPSILSELKKIQITKNRNKKTKLIVKDKTSLDKYQIEFSRYADNFDLENLEIEEKPTIIGGYILKNKQYKLDNSYKKKLLNLYSRIVS